MAINVDLVRSSAAMGRDLQAIATVRSIRHRARRTDPRRRGLRRQAEDEHFDATASAVYRGSETVTDAGLRLLRKRRGIKGIASSRCSARVKCCVIRLPGAVGSNLIAAQPPRRQAEPGELIAGVVVLAAIHPDRRLCGSHCRLRRFATRCSSARFGRIRRGSTTAGSWADASPATAGAVTG